MQKFSAIHTSVENHFNQQRHLVSREKYKQDRSAALAEWRMLAAKTPAPLAIHASFADQFALN